MLASQPQRRCLELLLFLFCFSNALAFAPFSIGGDKRLSLTAFRARESESEDDQRRALFKTSIMAALAAATATTTTLALPQRTPAIDLSAIYAFNPQAISETLTVPLEWVPTLNAYVVYYSVGGERFGAILDTGSPFLVVPSYCNPQQVYGCYNPQQSKPSGLENTFEHYDNHSGEVEWRQARFSFLGGSGSMMGPSQMTFGVLSESLMAGSGGVFLGLIRDTDDWIRPSFLSQTNVKALEIALRDDRQKALTLHTQSPYRSEDADGDDYIPLVTDLNRKYGDPVRHYTAKASGLTANGHQVLGSKDKTPIYVIIDTGTTGMAISQELYAQRYVAARANKEKSLWGSVDVEFQTQQGKTVKLSAQKPVATPLGRKNPWPKFKNAHLIVLGLAFLDGHDIFIDMDRQMLQLA